MSNTVDFQFITIQAHDLAPEPQSIVKNSNSIQTKLGDTRLSTNMHQSIAETMAKVKEGKKFPKLVSREISQTGHRMIHAYETLEDYWVYVNQKDKRLEPLTRRFALINDHEILSNDLSHCLYTGVFFDVDCEYDKQLDMQECRNGLYAKTLRFANKIKEVLNKIIANDNIQILIQEASDLSSGKISFHGLVKHPNLVFDDVTVIQMIVLICIWECIISPEYRVQFFFEEKVMNLITKKYTQWLDLAVYGLDRTFRCMYSTKRESTHRPMIPIYLNEEINGNAWFTKENLYTSMISVPKKWFFAKNANKIMLIKCTTTQKNRDTFAHIVKNVGAVKIENYGIEAIFNTMQSMVSYFDPVFYKMATPEEQISLNEIMDSSAKMMLGKHFSTNPDQILANISIKLRELHISTTKPEVKKLLDTYFAENGNSISINIKQKGLKCIQEIQRVISEDTYQKTSQDTHAVNLTLPRDKSERQRLKKESDTMKKLIARADFKIDKKVMVPFWRGIHMEVDDKMIDKYYNTLENMSEQDCYTETRCTKSQLLRFYKEQIFKSFTLVFFSENHFCYIKGCCHSSNNVYYTVNLAKMYWRQGCYSKNCLQIYLSQKPKTEKVDYNEVYAKSERFEFSREDVDLIKALENFKFAFFDDNVTTKNLSDAMEIDEKKE